MEQELSSLAQAAGYDDEEDFQQACDDAEADCDAENEEPRRAAWIICPECEGEGKSSAYLGAYTAEEFAESFDADEAEEYFAGNYDRQCDCCGGTGKIKEDKYQRYIERQPRYTIDACGREHAQNADGEWLY